jgi:hypothetical protein
VRGASAPPRTTAGVREYAARILQILALGFAVVAVLSVTLWQAGPFVRVPSLQRGWPVFELPMSVILVIGAIVAWVAFTVVHRKDVTHPRIGYVATRHEPFVFESDEIKRWQDGMSADQKSYLLDLICRPTRHIRRIKETVRFISTSIEIETAIVIDELEEEKSDSYLVPIHWQPRGTDVDGLQVTGPGGARVSTLVARDTVCAMLAIAFDLADEIGRERGFSRADVLELQSFARELISSATREEAVSQYLTKFQIGAGAVARVSSTTDAGRQFRVLTGRLTEYYPVVVLLDSMPTSEHKATAPKNAFMKRGRRLTVKHLEVPVALQKAEVGRSLRAFVSRLERGLERALFIEPPRIIHSIENADRARSFHLIVHAPAGLYFYNMRFGHLISPAGRLEMHATAPESQASGRNLQDFGHLYLRDANRATGYYAVTTFRERLPGSITEAMLVSGLITLLIVAVYAGHGAIISTFFSFLIPVIFATVGTGTIWRSLNQLDEAYPGRLASRVSSLATFVLAMLAVVQSALDSASSAACAPKCVGWDYSPWGWLLALAVANFLFALGAWRVDLLVERDFRGTNPAKLLSMEVVSRVEDPK